MKRSTSEASVAKAVTRRTSVSSGSSCRADARDLVPVIELCAGVPQTLRGIVADDREDLVGTRFPCRSGVVARRDAGTQPVGHGVGVGCKFQPQTVLEIGFELGRDEAGLGEKLRRLLADEGKLAGLFRFMNTMASAHQQPFFVAPNERISTPRFQVISAGEILSAVRALAKRAPSMWSGMSWLFAMPAMRSISSRE